MTPDELQAIEERESKATPGPWEVRADRLSPNGAFESEFGLSSPTVIVHSVQTAWDHGQLNGRLVITPLARTPYFHETHVVAMRADDAVFVAHAREDVPKLLAEVERLSMMLRRDQALLGDVLDFIGIDDYGRRRDELCARLRVALGTEPGEQE